MAQFFRDILEHHTGSGKRSTALQPLLVLAGIVGAMLISAVWVGAPTWMIVGLFVSFCILLLLIFWGYLYFMKTNPDALRSEKFNIAKMALERGMIGDKILGMVLTSEEIRLLPSGSADGEDQ